MTCWCIAAVSQHAHTHTHLHTQKPIQTHVSMLPHQLVHPPTTTTTTHQQSCFTRKRTRVWVCKCCSKLLGPPVCHPPPGHSPCHPPPGHSLTFTPKPHINNTHVLMYASYLARPSAMQPHGCLQHANARHGGMCSPQQRVCVGQGRTSSGGCCVLSMCLWRVDDFC